MVEEEMTCPVCDSKIPVDSDKCTFCGIETELLRMVEEKGGIVDDGVNEGPVPEETLIFECPICETDVAEDAKRCPKCGAIFEEGVEDEVIEDELEADFNERLAETRQSLSTVRAMGIGLDHLKALLRDATTAGSNGEYKRGIRITDECIRSAQHIEDINERVVSARHLIIELKDLGKDPDVYLDFLREAVKKLDSGLYDQATTEIENINIMMEEELESLKTKTRELEAEFKDKFEAAKKKLLVIRDGEINIEEQRGLLRMARDAESEGDHQRAIEHLDELLLSCESVSTILDIIEKFKETLNMLRERGLEHRSYVQNIRKGKGMADEGRYQEAEEVMAKTLEEAENALTCERVLSDTESRELYNDMREIVNDLMERVMKSHISHERIDRMIDRASEQEGKGNTDTAARILEKVVGKAEKLLLIRNMIDQGKVRLKELKKYGKVDKSYLDALKEGKKLADKGDYDTAVKLVTDTIEEMDNKISKTSGGGVAEISRKTSIKDIEDMVSELKDLLSTAKKHGIKVEGGREIISEALESVADKDFDNTLELLRKGKTRIIDYLKDVIDGKVVSLELAMDGISKDDVKTVERYLEQVKHTVEAHKIFEALEYLSKANSLVEVSEEPVGEAESNVAYAGKLLFDAEMLGIDVTQANELLDKAKLELEVGDWESADEFAGDARERIYQNVPARLQSLVREAQEDLKKAKIFGINVSEEIEILKSATTAKDQGDMVKCLAFMKRYKERIELLKV